MERVGQYLQNQNLQKQSRISITSDWSNLLDQNDCLKNSNFIYPHHKELSLVQEHNNLKESIRKLFEKPDILISLKLELLYKLDVCDVTKESTFSWHQYELDEIGSTLFSFTKNQNQMLIKEYNPRYECVKLAKFEFLHDDKNDTELSQKFPEMKMLHTQFYNDKAMSMLFAYKKDKRPIANCFVQFPIDSLLARLTASKIQQNIHPTLSAISLRELLNPELVRPLDINDGHILAVSGGRKIASVIAKSQRKFYHFEMEVDEGDYDENDGENETEMDGIALNNTAE